MPSDFNKDDTLVADLPDFSSGNLATPDFSEGNTPDPTAGEKVVNALRAIPRGVVDVAASLPESIAIAARELDRRVINLSGIPDDAPLSDRGLYQLGQMMRQKTAEAFPKDPRLSDSFWAEQVPTGIGSTIGFLGTGGLLSGARNVAGKALTRKIAETAAEKALQETMLTSTGKALEFVAKAAPIAASGAMVNAVQGYKDALDKGADEDTAIASFVLNGIGGVAEAAPIQSILNRINRSTGGGISKAIRDILSSGAEELIQESGQQALGNVIAQNLYDHERKTLEGVAAAGGVGGVTGALLSLLGIGGRRLLRGGQAEQPAVEFQDPVTGEWLSAEDYSARQPKAVSQETKIVTPFIPAVTPTQEEQNAIALRQQEERERARNVAIRGLTTVEAIAEAKRLVGEDELRRRANAILNDPSLERSEAQKKAVPSEAMSMELAARETVSGYWFERPEPPATPAIVSRGRFRPAPVSQITGRPQVVTSAPTVAQPATVEPPAKPPVETKIGDTDFVRQLTEEGFAETKPLGESSMLAWERAVANGKNGELPVENWVKGITDAQVTFDPAGKSATFHIAGYTADLNTAYETVTVTVTENGAIRMFASGGREPALLKAAVAVTERVLRGPELQKPPPVAKQSLTTETPVEVRGEAKAKAVTPPFEMSANDIQFSIDTRKVEQPTQPEVPPAPDPVEETTVFDPSSVPAQQVPVASVLISKDVPNFKADADPKTGVVSGERLEGEFSKLPDNPITIWRRLDGRLEVITGRHRLDLAKRSGVKNITAQIVNEADGFTKEMAMVFDAAANIRDEKGTVQDYADFFRHTKNITEQEAKQGSLLSRAKGRSGWDIGRLASDDLYALYKSGKISEAQTIAIVRATSDSEGQRIGARYALSGKTPEFLSGVLKASQAEASQRGQTLDLFGADDQAMKEMEARAERAASLQREILQQIRAVQGAAKNPTAAAKLGVDVRDPEGVLHRVEQLRAELERWENWPLHPDLVARVRTAEPLRLDQPESVDDQKARLAREEAERKAKEAREKIIEGAAKPLTGKTGDIGQGDLLGGGDLFSPPTPTGLLDDLEAAMTPEERAELAALEAELKKKLGQTNIGVDPTLVTTGGRIAFLYAKAGVRQFRDFANRMLAKFGEAGRQYLMTWYNNARMQAGGEGWDNEAEAQRIYDAEFAERTESGRAVPETVGGPGAKRSPIARVVRRELIPQPRSYVRTDSYAAKSGFTLGEEQTDGINQAVTHFLDRDGRAFVIADGTGFGKTAQLLGIIDQFKKARPSAKILFITQNTQMIKGSITSDSRAMGVDLGGISLTTYSKLKSLTERDFDLVIFDEAHNLKNGEAQKSMAAARIRAAHKLFSTATPMDRPSGAAYFLAEIVGKDEVEVANELGYTFQQRIDPFTQEINTYAVLKPGFSWPKVWSNIIAYRDAAIRGGAMLRREYPFYGQVNVQSLPMDRRAKMEQETIERHYDRLIDGASMPSARRNYSGQKTLTLRRWAEQQKVEEAFKQAMEHVNAGGQVIIMSETDKPQSFPVTVKDSNVGQNKQGREVWRSSGAIGQLTVLFENAGIQLAHIHDTKKYNIADEVDKFQTGRAPVALATPKSGGAGINLDDAVGNKPRLLIILSKNLAGDLWDQVLGRVSRKTTQSEARVEVLTMPDSYGDQRADDILDKKIRTLRAIQGGEDLDTAAGFESGQEMQFAAPTRNKAFGPHDWTADTFPPGRVPTRKNGFLGVVTDGSVSGNWYVDVSQPDHSEVGYRPHSSRFRYYNQTGVVAWITEPTESDRLAFDNWAAKNGVATETTRHRGADYFPSLNTGIEGSTNEGNTANATNAAGVAIRLEQSGEVLWGTASEINEVLARPGQSRVGQPGTARQSELAEARGVRAGKEAASAAPVQKARVFIPTDTATPAARRNSDILAHRIIYGTWGPSESEVQLLGHAAFGFALRAKLNKPRVVFRRFTESNAPVMRYDRILGIGDFISVNIDQIGNFDFSDQGQRLEMDGVLSEELIHAATLRLSSDEELGEVWQSLSPKEQSDVRGIYPRISNDFEGGAEYVRLILQERLAGTVTEQHRWRITDEIRNILRKLVNFLKEAFGAKPSDNIARQVIERIEGAIKGDAPIAGSVFGGGEVLWSGIERATQEGGYDDDMAFSYSLDSQKLTGSIMERFVQLLKERNAPTGLQKYFSDLLDWHRVRDRLRSLESETEPKLREIFFGDLGKRLTRGANETLTEFSDRRKAMPEYQAIYAPYKSKRDALNDLQQDITERFGKDRPGYATSMYDLLHIVEHAGDVVSYPHYEGLNSNNQVQLANELGAEWYKLRNAVPIGSVFDQSQSLGTSISRPTVESTTTRVLGLDEAALRRVIKPEDLAQGRRDAERLYNEAGIPWRRTSANLLVPQNIGAVTETNLRSLITIAKRELDPLLQAELAQPNAPFNDRRANFNNSIRIWSEQMRSDIYGGRHTRLPMALFDELFAVTQGEVSEAGKKLYLHKEPQIDEMQRIADAPEGELIKVWKEQYDAGPVQSTLQAIRLYFQNFFDVAQIDTVLAGHPDARAFLDELLGDSVVSPKPTVQQMIKAIFATPIYRHAELGQRLVRILTEQLGIPLARANEAARIFNTAFAESIDTAWKKALAQAQDRLTPKEKSIAGPGTKLWKKLQDFVNSKGADDYEFFRSWVKDMSGSPPTDADINQLRAASERAQQLLELTPRQLQEVAANPTQEDAIKRKRADATVDERAELHKRMVTLWKRFTRPLGWKHWFAGADIAFNNAQAANEWAAGNILTRLTFATKQAIDIGTTNLFYTPQRALAHAFQRYINARNLIEDEAGARADLWKDITESLRESYAIRNKTIGARFNALGQGFAGRGLPQNVEGIKGGTHTYDRIQLRVNELLAEGTPEARAKAFVYLIGGIGQMGFRVAGALDVFQGVPIEFQEIRQQVVTELRAQGKPRAVAMQQADEVIGDIQSARTLALAEARAILEESAEPGQTFTDGQVSKAAWEMVKGQMYIRMKALSLNADEFEARNNLTRQLYGWNLPEEGGLGGVFAKFTKGTQDFFARLGLPTGGIAAFGNAIGTLINRKLTWAGMGFLPPAFKGSPWYGNELEVLHRKAEAGTGLATGAVAFLLSATGAIIIHSLWPDDPKERERWEREGIRPGTVEIPLGDGTSINVSTTTGPLSYIGPYLAAGGALFDLARKRAERKAKADAEADKKGLARGEIDPISAGEVVGVLSAAAQNAMFGGRTASGIKGAYSDYGKLDLKRSASSFAASFVPGLPAYNELTRLAGVSIDPKRASFWDLFVPMPNSTARRVNMLGDDVGNPDAVQRVMGMMTGGTSIRTGNVQYQGLAYANLFASSYRPPPLSAAKGYNFGGTFRPMNPREYGRYVEERGKAFKQELEQLGSLDGLGSDEARKSAQGAFQRANQRALASVGISEIKPKRAYTRRLRTSGSITRRGRQPGLGRIRRGRTPGFGKLRPARAPRIKRTVLSGIRKQRVQRIVPANY